MRRGRRFSAIWRTPASPFLKGNEGGRTDRIPFLLPPSHFSSLYYSVSSFFLCHSTLKLSFILFSPGLVQPSIHPAPFRVPRPPPASCAPRTAPRPCLRASFQSINSVLMCYVVPMISDHLRLGFFFSLLPSLPLSPRHRQSARDNGQDLCCSSLLVFYGGNPNTEVNAERKKEGMIERLEAAGLRGRQTAAAYDRCVQIHACGSKRLILMHVFDR